MSGADENTISAVDSTPEYQEAQRRASAWALQLETPPTNEEYSEQANIFYVEELNRSKAMKTRAAIEKERKKREAEARAAAKVVKQLPPQSVAGPSTEAMDTLETVNLVPAQVVLPPSTAATSTAGPKSSKRSIEKVIDPDSGKDAPDPKRSNVPLDKGIK